MHTDTTHAARRRWISAALALSLCAIPAIASAKRALPKHFIAFDADLWAGESETPPAPTPREEALPEATPPEATPPAHPSTLHVVKMQSKEEIRAVIRAAKPALEACAPKLPAASDKVPAASKNLFVLSFRILPNGTVHSAHVSLEGDAKGQACLKEVLEGLVFPTAGMITDVSYPFR